MRQCVPFVRLLRGRDAWIIAATLLCLSSACADATPANEPGSDMRSAPPPSAAADREPLRVLVDGEDQPWRLQIDGHYLYWATRNALRRMPREGGSVTTLAMSTGIRDFVAADGGLYFTDGLAGTISHVDGETGEATTIATGEQPTGVAVHDGAVYWAEARQLVAPRGSCRWAPRSPIQ